MPDHILALPENLTVGELDELRSNMLEALSSSSAITINANDVENVDTAGVQLLVAFREAANVQHQQISWQQCTEALSNAAAALGFETLLSCEPDSVE